ncbi:type III secretion system chaperone [Chitinimonas lacunae]|uniref:Type III secretion system chaperone n=1 Tax=Chitinimonas lacunae TaxID=1963018 RepID=A0ABV8MT43_9NEIS
MEFHPLLAQLGQRLNLNVTGLDPATDVVQLTLGERLITIERQAERGVLSLSALLCFYPEPQQMAELCELLLEAHAFGILTNDACFALSRHNSQVLLFRNLPLDGLDPDHLLAALERFIAVLDVWKEALDSGRLFQVLQTPSSNQTTTAASVSFA